MTDDTIGAEEAEVAVKARVQGSSRASDKQPPRQERQLDVLHGVRLSVQVVLGEVSVPLRDLLGYEVGQVVSLDRPAGSPAEVIVNGKAMFRGEIVVVEDEYAVRITEVIASEAKS